MGDTPMGQKETEKKIKVVVPIKRESSAEIAKPLIELGVPKPLIDEFISKTKIKNIDELKQNMADYGIGYLWRSILRTEYGDIEKIFTNIENKKFNEEERQMLRVSISGAMRAAIALNDNLKAAGITDKEKAAKIINTLMFNNLTKREIEVYISGQTQKINIPFVLLLGSVECGLLKAITDAEGEPEELKKLYADYSKGIAEYFKPTKVEGSPKDVAKSIKDNLFEKKSEIDGFFVSVFVKGREVAGGEKYKGDLKDIVGVIKEYLDNAPKRVVELATEINNDSFTSMIKSKFDDRYMYFLKASESDDFKRYLIHYIGEKIMLHPVTISKENFKGFMDDVLMRYLSDNAVYFARYKYPSSIKKHLQVVGFATAPLQPQLSYLAATDAKASHDLDIDLLKITLNPKTATEEKVKALGKWQETVLNAYVEALKKNAGIALDKGDEIFAYFFMPRQLKEAQEQYGEKWRNKLMNSLDRAGKVFNVRFEDLLILHDPKKMLEVKAQIEKSRFYEMLSKEKGYKEDEILWSLLDIIPTVADLARFVEDNEELNKRVFEAIAGLKNRSEVSKAYDSSAGPKKSEYEREFMTIAITDGIAYGLNRPYIEEKNAAVKKASAFVGLDVEIWDSKPMKEIEKKINEGQELSIEDYKNAKEEILLHDAFKNGEFYKALKAKGITDDAIIGAAIYSLPYIAGVYFDYNQADLILSRSLKNMKTVTEADINKIKPALKDDIAKSPEAMTTVMGMVIAARFAQSVDEIIKSGKLEAAVPIEAERKAVSETKYTTETRYTTETSYTIEVSKKSGRWVPVEIAMLTDALWSGSGAVDGEMKHFNQNMKAAGKMKAGKVNPVINNMPAARYDLREHVGKDNTKVVADNYYKGHANMSYKEVLAMEKEHDSVYTTLLKIAKEKAARTVAKDEAQVEKLTAEYFVGTAGKLFVEYGIDFLDPKNAALVSKEFNLKFTKESLRKTVMQTPMNKVHGAGYRTGKEFHVGIVRDGELIEEIGTVSRKGVNLTTDSVNLKAGDYVIIYTIDKEGVIKLEAFNSALSYRQRQKLSNTNALWVNGSEYVELTMFNLNTKYNKYPITVTTVTSSTPVEAAPPTKNVTPPTKNVTPSMNITRKTHYMSQKRPLARRTFRAPAQVPLIPPPLIAVSDVLRTTESTITYTFSADPGEQMNWGDLSIVVQGWTGSQPQTPEDVMTQLRDVISSNINLIDDQIVANNGGTYYLNADGTWSSAPKSEVPYARVVIDANGNVSVYDNTGSTGNLVLQGHINRTTNELIVEKVRSYAFLQVPLARLGLGGGWTAGADLRMGWQIMLKRHGDFFLPSNFVKKNEGGDSIYMFPITLSSPVYDIGQGWGVAGYGGYVLGKYRGGIIGGLTLVRTFGEAGVTGSFQTGIASMSAGSKDLTISPSVGGTLDIPNFAVLEGGAMYNLKLARFGFYAGFGGDHWRLRTIFSPTELKGWAVIPEVVIIDNEGKEYGMLSTPLSLIYKGIPKIVENISDINRDGL